MAKAVATSGERKKIQVRQTKWKVMKMLRYRPHWVECVCLDFLTEGLEDAEGGEADAVEESPEDEGPADAVPEATEEKDDDGVEIGGALPAGGVGEGEVDVVAEPVGEGDVPAAPEVGDVEGLGRGG